MGASWPFTRTRPTFLESFGLDPSAFHTCSEMSRREPSVLLSSSIRLATLTVSPTMVYSLRCAEPMVPVTA